MKTKLCPKCHTTKPTTAFGNNRTRNDGLDVYCKSCKVVIDRQYAVGIREEAINAYGGPKCANCGETFKPLLVIDHTNGKGNVDRKIRGSGNSFLAALKREGWPTGFQVLCASCNFLKHFYPEQLKAYAEKTTAG